MYLKLSTLHTSRSGFLLQQLHPLQSPASKANPCIRTNKIQLPKTPSDPTPTRQMKSYHRPNPQPKRDQHTILTPPLKISWSTSSPKPYYNRCKFPFRMTNNPIRHQHLKCSIPTFLGVLQP